VRFPSRHAKPFVDGELFRPRISVQITNSDHPSHGGNTARCRRRAPAHQSCAQKHERSLGDGRQPCPQPRVLQPAHENIMNQVHPIGVLAEAVPNSAPRLYQARKHREKRKAGSSSTKAQRLRLPPSPNPAIRGARSWPPPPRRSPGRRPAARRPPIDPSAVRVCRPAPAARGQGHELPPLLPPGVSEGMQQSAGLELAWPKHASREWIERQRQRDVHHGRPGHEQRKQSDAAPLPTEAGRARRPIEGCEIGQCRSGHSCPLPLTFQAQEPVPIRQRSS